MTATSPARAAGVTVAPVRASERAEASSSAQKPSVLPRGLLRARRSVSLASRRRTAGRIPPAR